VQEVEDPSYLDEFDQLTLVRLLLAQHRADGDPASLLDAVSWLDRVRTAAQGTGRDASVIEIHLLRALVNRALGDLDSAVAELRQALAEGVPAGYVRIFRDEGEPMAELLRATEGIPSVRQHALLLSPAAYGIMARSTGGTGLSEREVEVLRLLATTLSGPEIARQLFVSVNTLRTHTKHIFTKLDVNTRQEAVRRAKGLGVI
jgi:LuxR family maltose regulon positive regulatory protein